MLRLGRWIAVMVLVCAASILQARPRGPRLLKEPASASVLVTGRVIGVRASGPADEESRKWRVETLVMEADVQVLRSFSISGTPLAGRIRIHFLGYTRPDQPIIDGYPIFPELVAGRAYVFPLTQNNRPESEPWRLKNDEERDSVVPTREQMAGALPTPTGGRGFLDREFANSLAFGTPQEVSSVAMYVGGLDDNLAGEIMPLIELEIGNDRERWAEVASTLLAVEGIPHPGVAEMLNTDLGKWSTRPSLFLPQAALRKLGPPSPGVDALLIQRLIADAPFHAWGSSNVLLEFADNPLTTSTLRQALRDDVDGSSYIAMVLAHHGNRAILPEALARALKVADRPNASSDLQGAAALLRDFGSDQDLKQLAALVAKYQTQDPAFYNGLWQYATEAGNPREVRVLAVVLRDKRAISAESRTCDFALGVLERATGQRFRAQGNNIEERDAAIAKAIEWLKSEGIED